VGVERKGMWKGAKEGKRYEGKEGCLNNDLSRGELEVLRKMRGGLFFRDCLGSGP